MKVLEVKDVSKSFYSTHALTRVNFDLEKGEVSVSLTWADEADQGTEVKDVKLWIFNADDGSLVEEKKLNRSMAGNTLLFVLMAICGVAMVLPLVMVINNICKCI